MTNTHTLIGGSGFIGSVLGRALLALGEKVVSVSLSSEGNSPGVKSVLVDLYRQSCPQDILTQSDNVFILLGQKHKGFDAEREKQIITQLAHSLKNVRSRIFYFSTALVYGQTSREAEEETRCHPLDNYSKYKLDAEKILEDHISPERLTILRLANIYGSPGNRGFIGLLMEKLSEPNPKVRLNGDGQQRRDFVFIDDLIQAIITMSRKRNGSGIVNISTGISHPLTHVIDQVSEISGQRIEYEITHIMLDEPQDSLIDNGRLREVYGYTKFTPLKEGLTKTLQRYDISDDTN